MLTQIIETVVELLRDETGTVGLEYGTVAGTAAGGVAGAVQGVTDGTAGAAASVPDVLASAS